LKLKQGSVGSSGA